MPTEERYVPAAGRAWLTGLYDPLMALTMRERVFRPALIAAVLADPRPRMVLDVGCGTGTLVGQLAEADTRVRVVGIDGDEEVLALARAKVAELDERITGLGERVTGSGERVTGPGERVRFSKGLAGALPIDDASVDVVIASLLLHHLAPESKLEALREIRRVLKPPGRLVIADWGRPHDPPMRAAFFVLQLLDGFPNTREHVAGRLPALVAQAGFARVSVEQRWRTMWGSLEMIVAEPERT